MTKDIGKFTQHRVRLGLVAFAALPMLFACSGQNGNQKILGGDPRYAATYGNRTGGVGTYGAYNPGASSYGSNYGPGGSNYRPFGYDTKNMGINGVGSVAALRAQQQAMMAGGGCPQNVPCLTGRTTAQICPPGGSINRRQPDGTFKLEPCTPVAPSAAAGTNPAAPPPAAPGGNEVVDGGLPKHSLWEKLCREQRGANFKLTPDSDLDGIPDDCEDTLKDSYFPALDKHKYNGYRVSGKVLTATELAQSSGKNPAEFGWFSKKILNRSTFNQRIAETILTLEDPTKSSINIVQTIFGSTEAARFLNPQKKLKPVDAAAVVKGGYRDSLIINQEKMPVGQPFTAGMLNGLGSNTNALKEGDKMVYIAESYVKVSGDSDITVSTIDGGRASGVIMVFVDGNLELSSIDVDNVNSRARKQTSKILDKRIGSISSNGALNQGWRHLVLALFFEEARTVDQARQMIQENVLITLNDTQMLLPQEIAVVNNPLGRDFEFDQSASGGANDAEILKSVSDPGPAAASKSADVRAAAEVSPPAAPKVPAPASPAAPAVSPPPPVVAPAAKPPVIKSQSAVPAQTVANKPSEKAVEIPDVNAQSEAPAEGLWDKLVNFLNN